MFAFLKNKMESNVEKILEILESNAKLSNKAIADMLGITEEEVTKRIKELENEKIIRGYHTIVDWDRLGKNTVEAIIELKVTPEKDAGFDRIARQIASFDEVQTVYLMSGSFDIFVRVEGKTMRDVAHFVSSKIATIDAVISTATHFLLKRFKENGSLFVPGECDDKRRDLCERL